MVPGSIGRYEVLGPLASGGMAEILLARLSGPADFKRAVVIKRILRSFATNASFVRMFLDEARIVASLRHPNIVHVQELGEHEGEAFLVMEYVAGENAWSLLKRSLAVGRSFEPALAAHLIAETCAGLHAAHELVDDDGRAQNLVHRDVSPQNILVGYDGHVKLVDFGVALVEHRTTLTEPGELKGKLSYMSPEQGLGLTLDRRSDIFALGVVLYELSTGRRLFKRPSAARTIDAICREPIVPPSRVVSRDVAYPAKLDAIVMRALAKEPAARYQSAAAMRGALLDVARELANPVETLAERMRELFSDQIAEKRELLRRVSSGEGVVLTAASSVSGSDDAVPIAPEGTLLVTDPRLASEAARRWRRTAFATGLGALAVSATVIAATRRPPTTLDASAPTSSAAAPPVAISSSEKSEPAAAEVASVVFHVESRPPGARVLIRGRAYGVTPLDVPLARTSEVVTLDLEKEGYETTAQSMSARADQTVVVVLRPRREKERRGPTVSRPSPRPSASVGGFRRFD